MADLFRWKTIKVKNRWKVSDTSGKCKWAKGPQCSFGIYTTRAAAQKMVNKMNKEEELDAR